MDTSDLSRHQIIHSHVARQAGSAAAAAVRLWVQLANKIVTIVGEGGFNAIYARSIILAHKRFSWLVVRAAPPPVDSRFAELKTSLEGRPPAQANEANIFLLITFTDILVSLIGEQLTITILRSAWGYDVSDGVSKGLKHE